MSRKFSKIVPASPLESERFFLDTINKLENTDTTLADEEQKSGLPFLGMVNDLSRRLESVIRDGRNLKSAIDSTAHNLESVTRDCRTIKLLIENTRQEQENRLLRSQITRLENRLNDLERRL